MLNAKELCLNLEHSNVCKFDTDPQKRSSLRLLKSYYASTKFRMGVCRSWEN